MTRGMVALLALLVVGCSHEQPPLTQRMPDVEWLPLQGPLGHTRLEVVVLLDGRPTRGVLDTGAMTSAVSLELAERMGLKALVDERGAPLRVTDAHGAVSDGWRTRIDSIALGRAWVDDVDVLVMPMGREVVLIGYDVLRRFDIVLLADLGVVGVLPPGTAPLEGREIAVHLGKQDRALLVDSSAPGTNDIARAVLTVDTGADVTSFPSSPAMLAGVPVDLRLKEKSIAVHTTKDEPGRYALRPMSLGDVEVGDVLAWEGTGEDGTLGLLGNDVLGRYRTTIVSTLAPQGPRLFVADVPRPAPLTTCETRALPPDPITSPSSPSTRRLDDDDSGKPIPPPTTKPAPTGPCLQVRIKQVPPSGRAEFIARQAWNDGGLATLLGEARVDDGTGVQQRRERRDDACLEIKIRRQTARTRVQFVVADDFDLLAGGVISVVANVDNVDPVDSVCLPLMESTKRLGVREATPVHIRAVRVDDDVDPALCPKGICHWYLGP